MKPERMIREEERGEGPVTVRATRDRAGRDRELVDGLELDEVHLSVPLSLLLLSLLLLVVGVSEAEKRERPPGSEPGGLGVEDFDVGVTSSSS